MATIVKLDSEEHCSWRQVVALPAQHPEILPGKCDLFVKVARQRMINRL